jgi:hypothetical protein
MSKSTKKINYSKIRSRVLKETDKLKPESKWEAIGIMRRLWQKFTKGVDNHVRKF